MRLRGLAFLACALSLSSTVASAGVGVWTTNGPPEGGGGPYVIADPLHPGTLYAGKITSIAYTGLYKSTDDGLTWARAGSLFQQNPKPLATAPPATVYCSSFDCGQAVCSGFVFVSPDGGGTWSDFYGQPVSFATYQMVVDPATSTTLFLGENHVVPVGPNLGAVYRSTDAGATWTRVDSGLGLDNAVISTMIGTSVSGTLYVATIPGVPNATHGLFKTVNGGATWIELTNAPSAVAALAADPTNPSIIYAGTASGVFKSLDAGASFASNSTGLTSSSVTSFAINPLQPADLFVGTTSGGVFESVDGGATWRSLNNGLTDLNITTLAIDSNGAFLHAGTNTGVFDYQFPLSLCAADTHTLCLNNGRFSVTADFQRTPEGVSSPATAVPLTADTGYFWFFDPANVEIVAKVLNGCATNAHYWFFAGGLTNVGVQIKVKDVFSGAEQDYSNAVGTPFAPIQDTTAFSTCP
jgi:photosystem II stability/assembly factor-like uncharacterized protein